MSVISNLIIRLTADNRGLTAGLVKAQREIAAAGSKSEKATAAMSSVGATMTRSVTIPILAAGAGAGKLAYDFEKSMTNIKAMVGASEADMKLYEEAIMRLSGETARAPKELAEAMYFVSSSGFEGAAAVRVLEQAAIGAKAGMGDAMTVADALTSAVNAYGEEALSTGKANDIMVKAVKVGKMEATELASNIGDVVTGAKTMGVEFDEVAGALAAMSLTGISTPEATTALNTFMQGLNKGTAQGKKRLDKVGLSYGKLRKMMEDEGVVAVMRKLRDTFGEDTEALSDIIPNVRALKAYMALMQMEGGKLDNVMAEVSDSTGAAAEAARKAEDDGYKLRQAWYSLQAAGIQLGKIILPVVAKIASGAAAIFKGFQSLPGPVKTFIVTVAALAAAIGPVLLVSAKLITAWRTLATVKFGAGLISQFGTLAGRIGGTTGKLGGFLSTAGKLGVVGIVAGAAIYGISKAFMSARDAARQAEQAFQNVMSQISKLEGTKYEKGFARLSAKGTGTSLADIKAAAERDRYKTHWYNPFTWGMASGGEFIARQPTPLWVGEGGKPEHVKVTPLSGGAWNRVGGEGGAARNVTNIDRRTVINWSTLAGKPSRREMEGLYRELARAGAAVGGY